MKKFKAVIMHQQSNKPNTSPVFVSQQNREIEKLKQNIQQITNEIFMS